LEESNEADSLDGAFPKTGPGSATWSAARKTLLEKLAQHVKSVDLDDVSLSQAIQWFEESSGVKVNVWWSSLRKEGIDPETPIYGIHLKDVENGTALARILDNASEIAPTSFSVWNDQVVVSPSVAGVHAVFVRRYDIRPILAKASGANARAATAIIAAVRRTIDRSSWESSGRFGKISEKDGWLTVQQTAENHDDLANLVNAWVDAGAPRQAEP